VAAAAADLAEVDVVGRPRVLIISTGDELDDPGRPSSIRPGIPDSISFGVASLVRSWGGEVVGRRRVTDSLPAMEDAAKAALGQADVVVVTGGASVGERDFAKAMFEPLGLRLVFAKVAIKPGKPVWLGRVAGTSVVGLPGNPTSALVTARLLLAPLISGLAGAGAGAAMVWRPAILTQALEASGDHEIFVRGRLACGSVQPLSNQDSSAQKALAMTDALIRRRPGEPAAKAGDSVEVLAF
jgi:molybdopterin molybdotransferase